MAGLAVDERASRQALAACFTESGPDELLLEDVHAISPANYANPTEVLGSVTFDDDTQPG